MHYFIPYDEYTCSIAEHVVDIMQIEENDDDICSKICSFLLNNKQDGSTTLHWACKGGYLSVVKDLLAKSADVNAKDNVRYFVRI